MKPKEQILYEKLSNRLWRLNNLYYIVDEDSNKIRFQMNPVQLMLFNNRWYLNIILKSRQHGISTLILIFILDCCLFRPNVQAGVIAQTIVDARKLFDKKIKFAYDNLPQPIKNEIYLKKNNSLELEFSNNSSIFVGLSMRGGTLHYLHVSELGKIAYKDPEKAQEIKTGALNTVHEGQYVFIESTSEGRSGLFYDLCQESQKLKQEKRELSKLEFKFFFFAWWQDSRNVTDSEGVVLTAEEIAYFTNLENQEKIVLKNEQKAWYALKWRTQKLGPTDKMKQEHPSTPEEAFEQELRGRFYTKNIVKARSEGRITTVPYEDAVVVNTFWDLGRNDANAIWFHQRIGLQNRFIYYYENHGESLAHYVKIIKKLGFIYGEHYLPHDVAVTDISREDNKSRAEVLEELGINPLIVVPRIQDISEGIEMTRNSFTSCWFDKSKCDQGIIALEGYQQEWDDKNQTFKDRPVKNHWANHGADAFRQFAQGFRTETMKRRRKGKTTGAAVA